MKSLVDTNQAAQARSSPASLLSCVLAAAVLLHPVARAQAVPDAGSVRQQIEQQRRQALPPKSDPQFLPPAPLESLGGATVTVRRFEFAGNTLLKSEQLEAAVAGHLGRALSFADLQNAAIAVANAYREAGWVVRAYLPKQEITDGTVTIQIVEATLGKVRIEGEAKRVAVQPLERIATTAQRPGAPVNARALDRALLLINDRPGAIATGRLAQGTAQSQTDLVLNVEDAPLVSGSLTLDDAGSRFTGPARITAAAGLDGQLGRGDRVDALLLHSDGSDYQRLAYSQPIGSRGLRAGLNASHLTYEVVTREFAALDAHGTSSAVGLDASYPVIRSRTGNLYASLNVDDRRFDNSSGGATTTRYSTQTAALGVHANTFDDFHGGGANSASLALVAGRIDLSGSPNEAIDALTTRTGGSFRKLRFSASRLQALTERLSLHASLSGQLASKNLDSSEKFYLGGSDGIRAYPQDEGGGSEGLMANLETRARLPLNFSLAAFVDWGRVRINEDNDVLGALARNEADFKGAGLTVGWTASFGLTLQAIASRRIGSNPLPTITGDDQDGTLVKNRFWLQASMPF
jgi:hemolysin activation/secretion protein